MVVCLSVYATYVEVGFCASFEKGCHLSGASSYVRDPTLWLRKGMLGTLWGKGVCTDRYFSGINEFSLHLRVQRISFRVGRMDGLSKGLS